MKKIFLLLSGVLVMLLASCGVGSYSVSGGMDEKAAIFVSASESYDVVLIIDGTEYPTKTVEYKAIKKRRDMKQLMQYRVITTPGSHKVEVRVDGQTRYTKTVILNQQETRIIEL